MSNKINIALIIVMIVMTVWSAIVQNWFTLVANICIISGVLIDDYTGKLLLKSDINYKLVRNIKKRLVPVLYVVGAIAIIAFGFSKYDW
jgi:hypothetical protein